MHFYLRGENARREVELKVKFGKVGSVDNISIDENYTEEMKLLEREKGDNASVSGLLPLSSNKSLMAPLRICSSSVTLFNGHGLVHRGVGLHCVCFCSSFHIPY